MASDGECFGHDSCIIYRKYILIIVKNIAFRAARTGPAGEGFDFMSRLRKDKKKRLEEDLAAVGLLSKAKELYFELGEKAALSYIRSSYRLLSKVYHPDLNPDNADKAKMLQQKLNRLNTSLKRVKDSDLLELVGTGEQSEPVAAKKKILVVEDEFGLQDTLREVFQMEGYEVRVAVDGDKGFQLYRKFKPDLVFTDIVMPKMNGLELVGKIRETNPDIKVVYVSGFFGVRPLKDALDEEVQNYGYPVLAKPTKISVMLDIVGEYLEA
jgi:CheY-like chemotaxis protein